MDDRTGEEGEKERERHIIRMVIIDVTVVENYSL